MAECEVCGRVAAQSADDYLGREDVCGAEVAAGIAEVMHWQIGYDRLRAQVAALTARAEAAEAKAAGLLDLLCSECRGVARAVMGEG